MLKVVGIIEKSLKDLEFFLGENVLLLNILRGRFKGPRFADIQISLLFLADFRRIILVGETNKSSIFAKVNSRKSIYSFS